MRAVARTAALFIITLHAASAFAQMKETSETIKLTGDLKHYQGMVAAYRQGSDDVVSELLTWDESRLDKAIGAINSRLDPNTPWSDDFLRSGALLQTAAGLRAGDEGHIDRMKFHFGLAATQLRLASADLAPFAGRWYYAAARLYRGYAPMTGFSDAEALLEGARRHIPSDPLVLYESAVLAEIRATEWRATPLKWHPGSGSSFRDMDALGDIVHGRATRLQNARDWLRQSVGTIGSSGS